MIHKRQKLINIADKNKDDWQIVEEYESDALASNSDNEKKIKKAKEAASRKRKTKRGVTKRNGRELITLVIISFFVVGLF